MKTKQFIAFNLGRYWPLDWNCPGLRCRKIVRIKSLTFFFLLARINQGDHSPEKRETEGEEGGGMAGEERRDLWKLIEKRFFVKGPGRNANKFSFYPPHRILGQSNALHMLNHWFSNQMECVVSDKITFKAPEWIGRPGKRSFPRRRRSPSSPPNVRHFDNALN